MTTKFPSPTDFLLTVGLYSEYEVAGDDVWAALDTLYFGSTYDCYCIGCQREATFKGKTKARPEQFDKGRYVTLKKLGAVQLPEAPMGMHLLDAECSRGGHTHRFVFLVSASAKRKDGKVYTTRTLQKIGQHPAFADLHTGKLKDYSDVLTKEQRAEFSRAIGLASHDVGIGAYVYLRRVFEALVEEAHKDAAADQGWNEETYMRARMGERIAALKHYLPQFLSEHPEMYSILSKGVHELSEQECLEHFPTLQIATELILDEKQQAKKRQKKIADAKAALGQIQSRLIKGGAA